MRRHWKGWNPHVTSQIVANEESYTMKVWHRRGWLYLHLERSLHIAIPPKGIHQPIAHVVRAASVPVLPSHMKPALFPSLGSSNTLPKIPANPLTKL